MEISFVCLASTRVALLNIDSSFKSIPLCCGKWLEGLQYSFASDERILVDPKFSAHTGSFAVNLCQIREKQSIHAQYKNSGENSRNTLSHPLTFFFPVCGVSGAATGTIICAVWASAVVKAGAFRPQWLKLNWVNLCFFLGLIFVSGNNSFSACASRF